MCDQDQISAMGAAVRVNRRQFARLGVAAGAGAAVSACATPYGSAASTLAESDVSFAAPGGTMDAFFVHPSSGSHPAIIMWPDIAGLREAKKIMARRLAAEGFAVIVLNPYYRSLPAPQFADFEDFRENDGFQKVGPWRAQNTAEAIMDTARAVVAWLDNQNAVDSARGIGNDGYCMGGPYTIWTAAAAPARVKAAVSFHGGGLVGSDATAPINLFPDLADDARVMIAIAKNDDERAPDEKSLLGAAATAAGLTAEIEVYDGDHGWTVLDSPVYDEAAAERAFGRMLVHYRAL